MELDAEVARLTDEIQAWVQEHFVGHASTASLRESVPLLARTRFAEGLGLPLDRVVLLNPRWSDDGRKFEADGFEVLAA